MWYGPRHRHLFLAGPEAKPIQVDFLQQDADLVTGTPGVGSQYGQTIAPNERVHDDGQLCSPACGENLN